MLNDQQIALFQRNGFINGGPVLDDETVDVLRTEVLRVIDERERSDIPQPVLCRNLNQDDSSPIWQIVNIFEASPAFKELISGTKIAKMAAQLTGANELRIWHDQIQYKPQAQGGRLHWHQDSPAWPTLQPKMPSLRRGWRLMTPITIMVVCTWYQAHKIGGIRGYTCTNYPTMAQFPQSSKGSQSIR